MVCEAVLQSVPVTIAETFQFAIQHHQAGRLAEAEGIYRQILAMEPRHADALHMLGVIAHQVGRNDVAVEMILNAIALVPCAAPYFSNIGLALSGLGRVAEAVVAYRQAIQLKPDYAEAHYNLGTALTGPEQIAEAVAAFRNAVQLKPDYAEAHNNLGVALKRLGQIDEAIAAYRRAVQLKPDYAEAHNNLGTALSDQGRIEEAVVAYRRAIQLKPDFAEALSNLGNAIMELSHIDEAVAAYRRAIELKPGEAEVHYNLGNALSDQGRTEEAIDEYRRAIGLKPEFADAHKNLGVALQQQGRTDEAMPVFRRAIELRPEDAEAHSNLGNALKERGHLDEAVAAGRRAIELKPDHAVAHANLGNAIKELGHIDEAMAAYRLAIRLKPDFPEAHNNLGSALKDQGLIEEAIPAFRDALKLRPDFAEAHSNLLLSLHYLPGLDPEEVFREHRRWEEVHAQPLAKLIGKHGNDPDPERRLRVGYVSPDFREHSVAFFLETLLAAHDRGQVEIFCYADLMREDRITERLRQHAGQWRRITGMTDSQVADQIREDGIDILVDLAGHTAHHRLLAFARKPAPVQVTWLGYCDTTGMRAMDYRLTDGYADPPGTTEHLHSERLVRLPGIFACFRPAEESPPVGPLPALERGHVTFGSFHMLAKLNDALIAVWAGILRQVPGSRLLLVAAGLDEATCQHRYAKCFSDHGIDPQRLEFRGRQALSAYLALHQAVDVLLDCHPHSGHTVGCHALWMGVPVVTLAGKTYCSRMMASVLMNLGMADWIARTPAEYVKLVREIATELPRLAALRSGLRERMRNSPLLDASRFARNVEQAYREMWRAWCAKQCSNPAS